MKKIISLISILAIILSFSTVAFGAELLTDGAVTVDGKSITSIDYDSTTGEFEVTATGITGQATLLAFPVAGLETTGGTNNIEFIDQDAATSSTVFNFKMKTAPTSGIFTIKVGGSNVDTALSVDVNLGGDSSDYTISGTVATLAPVVDADDLGDLDPAIRGDFIAAVEEKWATTVTLISFADLADLVKSYADPSLLDAPYVEDAIASTTADLTSGAFSLAVPSDVTSADYVLVFRQAGSMPFLKKVEFRGSNVVLDNSISFIRGDVSNIARDYNVPDFQVNMRDLSLIVGNMTTYDEFADDDDAFKFALDINYDLQVTFGDVSSAFSSFGTDYSDLFLADGIDFDEILE